MTDPRDQIHARWCTANVCRLKTSDPLKVGGSCRTLDRMIDKVEENAAAVGEARV